MLATRNSAPPLDSAALLRPLLSPMPVGRRRRPASCANRRLAVRNCDRYCSRVRSGRRTPYVRRCDRFRRWGRRVRHHQPAPGTGRYHRLAPHWRGCGQCRQSGRWGHPWQRLPTRQRLSQDDSRFRTGKGGGCRHCPNRGVFRRRLLGRPTFMSGVSASDERECRLADGKSRNGPRPPRRADICVSFSQSHSMPFARMTRQASCGVDNGPSEARAALQMAICSPRLNSLYKSM